MAFVKHFLNRALFQTIVDGTNAAGARLFTSERHPWSDLTLSEFWSYVAVVYEMGLSDLPSISDYWSHGRRRNQLIIDLVPSCHRFCQISRALRCMDFPFHADQENWRRAQLEHGPFAKTANFVTSLSQSFEDAYDLEQFLSLDEQSIPTKCQHQAVQFNKDKPWHFFLKSFALNSAVTGYLWKFYLYPGACEERPDPFCKPGYAHAYPVHLLTANPRLHRRGHILACDNWYTSHVTADVLVSRGIHFLGTVQVGRLGFRQEVVRFRKQKGAGKNTAPTPTSTLIKTIVDPGEKTQLNPEAQRGISAQAVLTRHGKIDKDTELTLYAVGWLDNKVVQLMSSFKSDLSTCMRRAAVDGPGPRTDRITLPQPSVIALYNRVMGGTDRNDQMLRYYARMSKGKWTTKVFHHLFYCVAYNAFVCFSALKNPSILFKDFLENVVTQMHAARTQYVHRHLPHERDHTSPTKALPRLQTIMKVAGRSSAMFDEHHLEVSPDGVRRCRVCHHHGKRHRVLTRCSNGSICKNAHVCIDHFVEFHNSALHLEAASDGDGDA
jgi:hypothetical protein